MIVMLAVSQIILKIIAPWKLNIDIKLYTKAAEIILVNKAKVTITAAVPIDSR